MNRWLFLLVAAALLASSTPVAAQEAQPLARTNRLSLALGFGLGWMSLGGLGDAAADMRRSFENQNPIDLSATPSSSFQINSEVALRYYLPYYVLVQVGYGATYNWASATFDAGASGGDLENHNVIMEVPFLLGGYVPLTKRLYVFGAAGPSYFFFARSYWDVNPGDGPDFKTDNGVGLHVLAGADLLLSDHFAFGLELRYRMLSAGELQDLETGATISSGMLLNDGSRDRYEADYSSFSVALNIRIFLM